MQQGGPLAIGPLAGVTPAHLKTVQVVVGMDVVVARPLLKIGARDRESVTQIDIPKSAQKIDLGAAQTA